MARTAAKKTAARKRATPHQRPAQIKVEPTKSAFVETPIWDAVVKQHGNPLES